MGTVPGSSSQSVSVTVTPRSSPAGNVRLASVDAYRGLVMFLMLAEVLRSCAVAAALPTSRWWAFLCGQQTHAPWLGCSVHDLIQPSFYFLVGVGAHFSISRRLSQQTTGAIAGHVAVRSLFLVILGMALVASHSREWSWRFFDTLTQIGLAYPFLAWIALRSQRGRLTALVLVLSASWLAYALYPLPPATLDYQGAGVSAEWLNQHGLHGFAAHWQKNANVAFAFDRWFLNLFPGRSAYTGEFNGLTTLNFVPSIATMILGLIAGEILRRRRTNRAVVLSVAGLGLLAAGWSLGYFGVCPVVKAVWTPSWVLFSGGLCLLFLAALHAVVDVRGFSRVVFPLKVIGTNSLIAYCLSHLYPAFAFGAFRRIFGNGPFLVAGPAYEPFLYGLMVLFAYWLFLFVLYRRGIFVRL